MAVFISYSHEDADFVDRLAANLVLHHAHVWVDRWELRVGDSLLDRVQSALQGASALLVVLSPASVASAWCRKELNAGLMRELDERRVVVLPLLVKDCEMPIFLKEKLYADFRKDFDKGLTATLEAIASVTSDKLGSSENPPYHSDWSVDWDVDADGLRVQVSIVDHSPSIPHAVLTTVVIRGNANATKRYVNVAMAGFPWLAQGTVMLLLGETAAEQSLHLVLSDEKPQRLGYQVGDRKRDIIYDVSIESRRVGDDNGKDIIVDLTRMLGDVHKRTASARRELTPEERARLRTIVGMI